VQKGPGVWESAAYWRNERAGAGLCRPQQKLSGTYGV
jgi:hypothetical protein